MSSNWMPAFAGRTGNGRTLIYVPLYLGEYCVSLHDTIDIAILGAVEPEIRNLSDLLAHRRTLELVGETFYTGKLQNKTLLVGTTGIGKVNAAVITAGLLERFSVGQVWNVGCAGCYREGPLQIGDVLVSQEVVLGDEGILTRTGVRSLREIGIPVLTRNEQILFERIPGGPILDRLRAMTPPAHYGRTRGEVAVPISSLQDRGSSLEPSFKLMYGPSLCVGMTSGDFAVATGRFLSHGAFAENMEGSAIAQACFRFETPFAECRGMSNQAGDRNKENWHIKEAIAHCHAIVANWLTV